MCFIFNKYKAISIVRVSGTGILHVLTNAWEEKLYSTLMKLQNISLRFDPVV